MQLLPWLKVLVCIAAVDVLLFRIGLLWHVQPDFGKNLAAENWRFLFRAAAVFETRPTLPGRALIVGSSVVVMGVDEAQVDGQLTRSAVPAELLRMVTHGSTCTDSALLAWNARAAHPWLMLYGAAARDFPKKGVADSGVIRTFYDASVTLPQLPRADAESVIDAQVKRYWKLYRYRFFTRTVLATEAAALMGAIGLTPPAWAAPSSPPQGLPPEALHYFSPYRITSTSYAAWAKWHASGRFEDYLVWLQQAGPAGTMTLNNYKQQTLANFGPEGNPQMDTLRWMLREMQKSSIRMVLLYFPENPLFRNPAAKAYFDPSLSQADATTFADAAAVYGARFEDLRNLLAPEDFYDLIHPNLEGQRKVSARIAAIIEEEWHAHIARGAEPGAG